jgi:DNA-binding LacI/PurR family transcriptional regulator
MAVTIRDIAEATGLSSGTVSRALNEQPGLTEDTRAMVRKAAKELGYDLAKLKPVRVRRIAFALHRQHNTLSASPFYSPVLHGAEDACRRADVALSFVALGPAEPVLSQIRLHTPDALLCAGFFEPEVLAALREGGKRMVLVDMHLPGYTCVNPDHRLGGYLATRHLLDVGRKRIAMLSGSMAHFSIRERAHGFRQALFEAHVLANPAYEITLPEGVEHGEGVASAMRALLALVPRPDAIFCFNDSTALAAMRHCLGEGLKIPHDMAIVGFDDIEDAARSIPPLTSVRIDKEALGAAGIDLLLNKAIGNASELTLPVRLIVRESSTDD